MDDSRPLSKACQKAPVNPTGLYHRHISSPYMRNETVDAANWQRCLEAGACGVTASASFLPMRRRPTSAEVRLDDCVCSPSISHRCLGGTMALSVLRRPRGGGRAERLLMSRCSHMPRIAFYSHDTMGLGHVRRNLVLARAIVERRPDTSVLLISGTHLGGAFRMPPGVDCITLPALGKNQGTGAYSARHLSCPIDHIIGIRSQTIRAALERFDPHLLVVDNVPLGALGELEPTLAALRVGRKTRTVLGLRDILDEPHVIEREWSAAGHHASIERYYDQVWIYGDPFVYDLTQEYGFPESTRRRVRYVGYLDRRSTEATSATCHVSRPFTLCLSGGGQDGTDLAMAFAESSFPDGELGVLLTGPFCPAPVLARAQAIAAVRPELQLIEFTDDGASLIEQATRVIGMAGYNSVCEMLAYRKPALLVPREAPRREQVIRAERFAEIGLVDMLPLGHLNPGALSRWMARAPQTPRATPLRFTALEQVSQRVTELLEPAPHDVSPAIAARQVRKGSVVHVH